MRAEVVNITFTGRRLPMETWVHSLVRVLNEQPLTGKRSTILMYAVE